MRVIWEVVATVFYFENDSARNLIKEYIFRFAYVLSTNQNRGHFDHHMLHMQDIDEEGPCTDSAQKPLAKVS